MAIAWSGKAASMEALSLSPPMSPPVILTQDELKKIAAYKAVEFVESGMVLGLGTGSTAKHAVDRIGDLLRQGKLTNIVGIPTSKKTQEQALSLGIPLSDLDSHPVIDLAIDGADEVDPHLNLVKGRGGSLLREKMVEGACKKFVCIVDESKLVKHLGGSGLALPVEVVPFCWKFTANKLHNLFERSGCVAKLRNDCEGKPFVTDNGNYIIDLYLKTELGDLQIASGAILRIAGVVEHERAKHFLCLVTKNKVLSNQNRHHRHLTDGLSCHLCRLDEESTLHLLRDCCDIKDPWFNDSAPNNSPLIFLNTTLKIGY